jgi:hypothetical protein
LYHSQLDHHLDDVFNVDTPINLIDDACRKAQTWYLGPRNAAPSVGQARDLAPATRGARCLPSLSRRGIVPERIIGYNREEYLHRLEA